MGDTQAACSRIVAPQEAPMAGVVQTDAGLAHPALGLV